MRGWDRRGLTAVATLAAYTTSFSSVAFGYSSSTWFSCWITTTTTTTTAVVFAVSSWAASIRPIATQGLPARPWLLSRHHHHNHYRAPFSSFLWTCLTARVQSLSSVGKPKDTVTMMTTPSSITASQERQGTSMTAPTKTYGYYPPLPPDHPLYSIQQSLQNSWIHQLNRETLENWKKSLKIEEIPTPISSSSSSSQDDDDEAVTSSAAMLLHRRKRPIFNGHYVLVQPTGLRQPQLLLYSQSVAHDMLQFTVDQMNSDEMVEWLSGNFHSLGPTWATPYALSIMGQRYTSNCPYGTGQHGYGDGRAISIGEVQNYEIQGKGIGTTPFCRGADGRAVLRSSIREFLASEAMHHLQVPTTRALSLIVSHVDTVYRPWYSDATSTAIMDDNTSPSSSFSSRVTTTKKNVLPSLNDPRLDQFPTLEQKQQVLRQLRFQKSDPDRMIQEACAITCRVSRSFVRIGHLDLFARRAIQQQQQQISQSQEDDNDDDDTEDEQDSEKLQNHKTCSIKSDYRSTLEWKEYEQMIWHACYREYRQEAYEPHFHTMDLAGAADAFLRHSAVNLATMVTHWIRVGFVQGNFNADNCLVGGYTMDYGPFGFVEEYNPVFAKWTGSGQHFGFLNQIHAGFVNYQVLVESVLPAIAAAKNTNFSMDDLDELGSDYMNAAKDIFQSKLDETFRIKMGLHSHDDDVVVGDELWESLEPLMRSSRVDWTLFWRQLTYLAKECVNNDCPENQLLIKLEEGHHQGSGQFKFSPFYEPLNDQQRSQWTNWLKRWRLAVRESDARHNHGDGKNTTTAYDRMVAVNPKYVLREWMLVKAYTAANSRKYELLHELYQLIQSPYEEGTAHEEDLYYRRAPDDVLIKGGTAYMSCSS